ncbi:MAG: LysM peptidoglycan-binding domain-containing protein [Syntrophales bacterium]|nr:LysM peptidoglycan-binding domain-containing protein [Syntrophales bacterium]
MTRDNLLNALVIMFVLLGFLFSGCAKKPAETAVGKEESAVKLEEGKSVLKETLVAVEEVSYADRHVVKRGECLWWIAKYKDIYNDPFQWPIIYDANSNLINDPDLIYPGQIFSIPRKGYTIEEVKEARKRAGAPRPYAPPQKAFVLTE